MGRRGMEEGCRVLRSPFRDFGRAVPSTYLLSSLKIGKMVEVVFSCGRYTVFWVRSARFRILDGVVGEEGAGKPMR